MYIVAKITFICTSFRNRLKSESLGSFSGLFRSECKLNLHLPTMYVNNCVYPAMSKSSKQEPSCLKIAEKSVIIIFFKGVLYAVHTYTVTISYCRFT